MNLFMSRTPLMLRALAMAVPVALLPVVVTQVQTTFGLSAGAGLALAQQGEERETRRTPALRNSVYEKLAEAQTAAEAKDLATAQAVLDEMLDSRGRDELNSYELANVYNLYAFLHYAREDFVKARQAYENVVAQPDIPLAMEINTRYTIAQLYFVQEEWQKGVEALLRWFEMTENPSAESYVLLSQGYYQQKDYARALQNVETAMDMYGDAGKVPKEQWYNLARFLYTERGDFDSALQVVRDLVTFYPKKDYWVQLGYMYSEKNNEKRQLAAMETAYVQDLLDRDAELRNLASLYLAQGVPYKGAKVIDAGLEAEIVEDSSKNYELMAGAWRQAQEIDRAIPAMEIAAQKSDSGDLYARLGSIYLDAEEYGKAIEAINKGLERGGVKRADTAQLVLGMAYFNQKQYERARQAFRAAGRDKRSEQYARQWIRYMDSEIERQQKMQES